MSAGLIKDRVWNVPFCILNSPLNLESYSEPDGGSLKALNLPLNSLLDSEKPREKGMFTTSSFDLRAFKELIVSRLLLPPNKTHHVHTLEIQQGLFLS